MAGIYVHVPFCKSKCTYCDFASYPKEIGKAEAYFACLYREIKGRGLQLKDKTFDTVYFGGGTPSIVDPNLILGAMRQIKECLNLSANAEITIEVNPATLTDEKYKTYKKAGVNRYSIGLQTGIDEELKRLNRIHTAKDFLETTKILKDENFSVDILIGLHNQTEKDLINTIDLAILSGAKHISMYALTPEVGTPIYTDYLNGELLSDDETATLYEVGVKHLKEKGFNRYEVSNFAKDGYYSKHNYNYWMRGEYIGFGVSASSFINERRFTNTFNVEEYINAIIANKTAEISSDNIEEVDRPFEYIMLALRTAKGLNIDEFKKETGLDFYKEYANPLKKYSHCFEEKEGYIFIKDEYLYVQNTILIDFMK